jgi:regulatory protein
LSADLLRPVTGSKSSARNAAMNILANREHSCDELRIKLAKREYDFAEIETALTGLLADDLVSDDRFAENFVASRISSGQGPVRIRMELEKRGVDSDIIRIRLDDAAPDWLALACDVRQRKFGAGIPAEYKEKARQMRFLEYRGFTNEHIRSAVGEDF